MRSTQRAHKPANTVTPSHTMACAIMATASELLNAGLGSILKESAQAAHLRHMPLSSISMCILCASALRKQEASINETLEAMITKYNCNSAKNGPDDITSAYRRDELVTYFSEHITGVIFEPSQLAAVSKSGNMLTGGDASMDSCELAHGMHGRMLQTSFPVGRGHVMVEEPVTVAVKRSPCNCHSGPVMVEHVAMAWALGLTQTFGKNFLSLSIDDKLQLAPFLPAALSFDQMHRLDAILRTLQSGFGDNVLSSMNFTITADSVEGATPENVSPCWSLDTQLLMVVCSVLCSQYTRKHLPSLKLEATSVFQYLGRLPHNIHAVFVVRETSRLHEEAVIEQQRLGFGLFLTASAVNHSCAPNGTIRYRFDNTFNRRQCDDVGSVLQWLRLTSIEVLAVASIGKGCELTISYGPTAGKHAYISRQECLQSQYLFQCRCVSCQTDITALAMPAPARSGLDKIDTAYSSTHVSETIHLCGEIDRLRSTVATLNTELAHFLSTLAATRFRDHGKKMTTSANSVGLGTHLSEASLIEGFEVRAVQPVLDDLRTLQARHFHTYMYSTTTEPLGLVPGFKEDRGLYLEFCEMFSVALDAQARLLAKRERFAEAAESVKEAVGLMVRSGMYGPNDVAIGREKVKLGQLMLSAGSDLLACRSVVDEAVAAMKPYVQAADPDWVDATAMLQYLNRLQYGCRR